MPPKPGEPFALYTHTEPDEDGVYHVNLTDDYTHPDGIRAAQAYMETPERGILPGFRCRTIPHTTRHLTASLSHTDIQQMHEYRALRITSVVGKGMATQEFVELPITLSSSDT